MAKGGQWLTPSNDHEYRELGVRSLGRAVLDVKMTAEVCRELPDFKCKRRISEYTCQGMYQDFFGVELSKAMTSRGGLKRGLSKW
jgi:hypothetical protein